MKNLFRMLLTLGMLLPLLACSSGDLVGGALTAVVPATPLPTGTPVPPTNTPLPPTATPVPPTPIPVDVVITAVVNKAYAEHVVVQNQDTIAADLTGWTLAEKDGAVLPFAFPPGFTLAPGAEVRIYSGRDGRQNNPPESFDWTELNIWDNDGDTATLFNSIGTPVSTLKYP
jgi:hypothetical protein